ncbi:MAG TPA: hypothetical protein VGM13_12195 [Thermoanaerobaculia bacterium]|jgi:hypothetical protein
MKRTPAIAAALFALAGAAHAADKVPQPGGPVPVPYPNTATSASSAARDPQSGLPTGKRMHKPWVFSASDKKINLADGRTFVVNAQTGEVVFGDGAQGKRPEAGNIPVDGKYRLGGGAAGNVEVRSGRIVTPTPAPTRAR